MRKMGLSFVLLLTLISCVRSSLKEESFKVVLFVAGQLQGNPPLDSLLQGIEELKKELGENFELSVLEAGYQQSEWDLKFRKMVSSTKADLYITSNPSMRRVVEEMAEAYADKRFLLFESPKVELPNVVSVDFRSEELAYLAGVYASVFLKKIYPSIPPYVGIIVAQEYPKMDAIISQFKQGFNSLGHLGKTSYHVLGNWYDAERARQISSQFYQSGVMGILTISGLANQGVVQATREKGSYLMFYESDPKDPALEENFTIFSGFVDYKSLSYRLVKQSYENVLTFGEHYEYGISDGVLGFLNTTDTLKVHLASVKEELEKAKTHLP